MSSNRRIEIEFTDPDTYSSIINHDIRKRILRTLYDSTKDAPISKQDLADKLGVGYHRLGYQLNNHLKDFWTVREERKVRGARMGLIEPAKPSTVYIIFGKDNGIFMMDPAANRFGPLSRSGTRCDTCSPNDAAKCMSSVSSSCPWAAVPNEAEKGMLISNGRKMPFKTIDYAILGAIKGIPQGKKCVFEVPGEGCALMRQPILIKN